ncbi:ABC transporter permease [Bdellovibrio sp. SKB1291214]|uniref:ABC transporter permease n=1 Tax=Bdellovibrio sp. SKB1291214 TaxID=1732569 RepID=UPI000B518053|nr:ABC transporter permease [Bdellovibrio sp. SKB1291214]UYL08294.1 ABC transporter permease [Bdellovibrio sp. SKB1291214]
MIKEVKDIYKFRHFILNGVKRDFQVRYKRSILGVLWIFIQPLAMISIYTLIFSQLARVKIPNNDSMFGYSMFLCSGLLTWNFLVETITRSQSVYIDNANLIKKAALPKICFPVSATLTSLVNLIIVLSLFFLFLIITGNFPIHTFIYFPLVLLVHVLFSFSVGNILGVLNVFFRDVSQMMTVFIQVWFWGTPIVYMIDSLPPRLRFFVGLNPATFFAQSYQSIVLDGSINFQSFGIVTAVSLILCLFSLRLLRKHGAAMADEL